MIQKTRCRYFSTHRKSLVKKGDDVLITERGRVIARIVKEDSRSASLRQALQPLVLKGQVVMPVHEIKRDFAKPVDLPGRSVSKIILEEWR